MREEEEKDGYEKQSRQQKREQSRAEDGYEKQSETLGFLDGLTLVSYISVPSIIERSKQSLKAPKSIISISCIFFGHPVSS